MAGRPKRKARLMAEGKWVPKSKEPSGIPAGIVSAGDASGIPASGIPAGGVATYPDGKPFPLVTGHASPRVHRAVASKLVEGLLAERPDLVNFPEALHAWARSETRALLLAAHLSKVGVAGPDGEVRASLLQAANGAENAAARARAVLGLSPLDEARLAKERAEVASLAVDLQGLADQGAQILQLRAVDGEGGGDAA
ncbi:hypothetical protein [Micropruina sp.]|uniref:hypothetical protein n=1 Tax=Micropruina sp. TaxID=2737536 RepID=UPI0039E3F2B2